MTYGTKEHSQTPNKNGYVAKICDNLKKTNVVFGTDIPKVLEPERPLTSSI
jgi:hypothetical protein